MKNESSKHVHDPVIKQKIVTDKSNTSFWLFVKNPEFQFW